jgi:hypothetical protein
METWGGWASTVAVTASGWVGVTVTVDVKVGVNVFGWVGADDDIMVTEGVTVVVAVWVGVNVGV